MTSECGGQTRPPHSLSTIIKIEESEGKRTLYAHQAHFNSALTSIIDTQTPLILPRTPVATTRHPIVPAFFYTSSIAKDRKMDKETLCQAFNANPIELKQLLNAAAIRLGERGCLGLSSRSKAVQGVRSEAVLAAIRSIPSVGDFFEKHIKRYSTFVNSMSVSIARLCDDDYKGWQKLRAEDAKAKDRTESMPEVSAVSTGGDTRAAIAQLPTPPATPRKKAPAAASSTNTPASIMMKRTHSKKTSSLHPKKKTFKIKSSST